MRSEMAKHWGGKGYNSPIQQVNMHTKLKDVPEELVNSGKKVISNVSNAVTNFKNNTVNTVKEVGSKIGNATVGEALNVTGIAYGIPPRTLNPKEKKLSAVKTKLKPRR
jgi:hypothetical protein